MDITCNVSKNIRPIVSIYKCIVSVHFQKEKHDFTSGGRKNNIL